MKKVSPENFRMNHLRLFRCCPVQCKSFGLWVMLSRATEPGCTGTLDTCHVNWRLVLWAVSKKYAMNLSGWLDWSSDTLEMVDAPPTRCKTNILMWLFIGPIVVHSSSCGTFDLWSWLCYLVVIEHFLFLVILVIVYILVLLRQSNFVVQVLTLLSFKILLIWF